MSWAICRSSATPRTLTRDVSLNIPMTWLPVAGMMEGMAWGMIVLRLFVAALIPRESAASICPLPTEENPPRMISAMYAASFNVKPTKAAVIEPMSAFVSIAVPMSVNGIPMVRFGYRAEMLNQKISWTRTGVPRNRVMNAPAVAAIGLTLEDLMIAMTRPRRVPRAMLASVRKMVSISPRRIDSWVKYLATTSHLKLGLVETEKRMPAPNRMETTQATYSKVLLRRRRGLSGGSIPFIVGLLPLLMVCTMGAPLLVEFRIRDGSGIEAPG